jgi:hypothetical protein
MGKGISLNPLYRKENNLKSGDLYRRGGDYL